MRHLISQKLLKMLYYSFIQPHIDYGVINWGCTTKTSLEPIKKYINKAFRIMTFKKYNEPITPIAKDLNMLTFDNYKIKVTSTFIWKQQHSMLPSSLNELFIYRKVRGSDNKMELAIPYVRTEYKKRFISYAGVLIWRTIPQHIRDSPTLHKFKANLSKYLLQ